jgi:Protein of unknown function (DUF3164)
MNYKIHKPKDKFWIDESGTQIPVNRINRVERLHERYAGKIIKQALDLNKRLLAFNQMLSELSQDAFDAYMASKGIDKKTKGNFTWFNFDRSVKIEVNVNEPIVFDSLVITAAKHKLDLFLDQSIDSKNNFVKAMIIEAFETQRNGYLDVKQVLKLTSYENRIKHPLFTEAIKLIREAIRRPKTKIYRRVWLKNSDGKYKIVELNLSKM